MRQEGRGGGRGSSRQRLLPEPRACGRHLGELKDLADGRGWERGNSRSKQNVRETELGFGLQSSTGTKLRGS